MEVKKKPHKYDMKQNMTRQKNVNDTQNKNTKCLKYETL